MSALVLRTCSCGLSATTDVYFEILQKDLACHTFLFSLVLLMMKIRMRRWRRRKERKISRSRSRKRRRRGRRRRRRRKWRVGRRSRTWK